MKCRILAIFALSSMLFLLTACSGVDIDLENDGVNNSNDIVTGSEPEAEVPAAADNSSQGILSSFTTVDLNGDPVDQSVMANYQLNVLNVWATYCSSCLQTMPALGELAAEYNDKGVQFIGLVVDTQYSDGTINESQVMLAQDIVERTGANYLHILPSADLVALISQVYLLPTTLFFDSNGKQVGDSYLGAKSEQQWTDIIQQMLVEVE